MKETGPEPMSDLVQPLLFFGTCKLNDRFYVSEQNDFREDALKIKFFDTLISLLRFRRGISHFF